MHFMLGRYAALVLTAGWAVAVLGNNIRVTNTAVVVYQPDAGLAQIRFDIAWENSWRYTNVNHDAAWVFFKAQKKGATNWTHVKLTGTGTNPVGYSTGAGTGIELIVPDNGAGVFVRRAAEGSGAVSVTNVHVAWNFFTNGLTRTSKAKIQTLVIEMVYVAEGTFNVGSGGSESINAFGFYKYPTTNATYAITNEAAITVWTNADMLYFQQSAGPAFTIPDAFPKGFAAFYCMKYEITQGQYKDFLNSLTSAQQTNRVAKTNASFFAMAGYPTTSNILTGPVYRNGICTPANVVPDVPITFGCDFNTNGVFDEAGDGQDLACNFLSWYDVAAFVDWSGLRPMTELEFEKACRGTNTPVANEYAWGSTTITRQTAVVGTEGSGTETASPTTANCHYNYGVGAVVRVGIYATASSSREAAGASYWGIMELSGNLYEEIVTVSKARQGLSFTGMHGDGILTATGDANVTNWPGTSPIMSGGGIRGGSWTDGTSGVRVSDRSSAESLTTTRVHNCGGRAVRTAPAGVGP